ncbi:MAG: hypothetical protein J7484_13220 [Microbacterium sp.]|nr:hypothetical protein [Microbacterium sp.]
MHQTGGETGEDAVARRRIAVMPAIGLAVASTAVSWTITHAVPVTVRSASELSDVAFGWPLAWYHQDLTRYGYADFPVEVSVVGDRVDPVPTTVDWLPFVGDIALTALVMWPICTVLLHLLAQVANRARPASEQPT